MNVVHHTKTAYLKAGHPYKISVRYFIHVVYNAINRT